MEGDPELSRPGVPSVASETRLVDRAVWRTKMSSQQVSAAPKLGALDWAARYRPSPLMAGPRHPSERLPIPPSLPAAPFCPTETRVNVLAWVSARNTSHRPVVSAGTSLDAADSKVT